MESNVEELEKLKRRLTLELSLGEVEPHYRNVMRQLVQHDWMVSDQANFLKVGLKNVSNPHIMKQLSMLFGFIDETPKNELQQALLLSLNGIWRNNR